MANFKEVSGKDFGDIRLYALSTCGWCKKTKAFLKDHNVAYSYIDVDLLDPDEAAVIRKEQLGYNPAGSFPTIVIGSGDCIVGYDEARLRELVGE